MRHKQFKNGGARELEPFSNRKGETAAYCHRFGNTLERMRCGRCQDRGIRAGSDVAGCGCRSSPGTSAPAPAGARGQPTPCRHLGPAS